LSRSEGYGGFLAALRANRFGFDFVIGLAAAGCGTQHRHPFGFAGLAALGLVLELLIVEKQLFSRGEDEIGAAVNALQHLVLEFH